MSEEEPPIPAWKQPRALPQQSLPQAAGLVVIVLALPLFLVAGWPLSGWGVGAVLWLAFEALSWFLVRARGGTGNLAPAGVAGFLKIFRAIVVMVVVLALVTSDKWVGVAAALVYAAAYTAHLGLSLVTYYSSASPGAKETAS
jgi:hypothetical protein